jgi:aspartate/tyrosine/aromatic aminotransferase
VAHARATARRLQERFQGRRNFDFLVTQRGMFSYTGLSSAQVQRLRQEHGVYLVGSGRLCVSGLSEATCRTWRRPSPPCYESVKAA